jgi:LysM repeat protein
VREGKPSVCCNVRVLGLAAGLLLFASCRGPEILPPPPPVPEPAPLPPPDTRTSAERLTSAIQRLERGEGEKAREELEAVIRAEPGNERAKSLLAQIDADPAAVLGKEWFTYTVQPGDTLSKVAKRFLNDPYKFYILARYNGISNPSDLRVGQTIRVPGKKPSPSGPEEPAPAPAPAPKPPEGEQVAERQYQAGLQALGAGNPERAFELFSEAVRANPKHTAAQAKLGEARAAAAEAKYRKAVIAMRRQDPEQTINYCNLVLEIEPAHEKARLLRMQALDLQERMKKIK